MTWFTKVFRFMYYVSIDVPEILYLKGRGSFRTLFDETLQTKYFYKVICLHTANLISVLKKGLSARSLFPLNFPRIFQ